MAQDQFQREVITIADIQLQDPTGSPKFKITDTKKRNFGFFQNLKDGGATKAYQTMLQWQVKKGSTIGIAYTERDGEYQGRPYKARDIKLFEPAEDIQYQERNMTTAKRVESGFTGTVYSTNPTKPTPPTFQKKEETVWDGKDRLSAAQTSEA